MLRAFAATEWLTSQCCNEIFASSSAAPKALRLYGIKDDEYEEGEKSMFDQIHKLRTRIITSPAFNGDSEWHPDPDYI